MGQFAIEQWNVPRSVRKSRAKSSQSRFARLLVVDDSPEAIGLVLTSLQFDRCRFRWAEDGFEAANELIKHSGLDLIILDYYLPGMNAATLLAAVDRELALDMDAQINRALKIPVVIMSASPVGKTQFSNYDFFHVVDVWQKPLSPDQIRENVGRFIGKKIPRKIEKPAKVTLF